MPITVDFPFATGFKHQDITFQKELDDGRSLDFRLGTSLMERMAALLSCKPEACGVVATEGLIRTPDPSFCSTLNIELFHALMVDGRTTGLCMKV